MPLERVEHSPAEYNQAWRFGFGSRLSGADKVNLAQWLGVSVRTVQRWTTTAGQQRNPFPRALTGRENLTWPDPYLRRGEVTRRLAFGGVNEDPPEMPWAEFGTVVARLSDADRFAKALEEETIDPWLTAAWAYYFIARTERGWEVRVAYSTQVSPETGRVQ